MVTMMDYGAARKEALRKLLTPSSREATVPMQEAGFKEDVSVVVVAHLSSLRQFLAPNSRLLLAVDSTRAEIPECLAYLAG